MARLSEKITNKKTGEILAYRLKSAGDRIKADKKLGEYEDAEEKGLLHIAPIPNGTTIYVWQTDKDDRYFVHHELYLYGYTEYLYGEFGKDFFISEEDCRELYTWE